MVDVIYKIIVNMFNSNYYIAIYNFYNFQIY